MFAVDFGEFFMLYTFATKYLHDVHACDMLLHEGIEVGNGIAHFVEGYFNLFFENISYDQ